MSDSRKKIVRDTFYFATKDSEKKLEAIESYLKRNKDTFLYVKNESGPKFLAYIDNSYYIVDASDEGWGNSDFSIELLKEKLLKSKDSTFITKVNTSSSNQEEISNFENLIKAIEYTSFYKNSFNNNSDIPIGDIVFKSYDDYVYGLLDYYFYEKEELFEDMDFGVMFDSSNLVDKTFVLSINGQDEFGEDDKHRYLVVPLFISEEVDMFASINNNSIVYNNFSNRYRRYENTVSCLLIPMNEDGEIDLSEASNVSLDDLKTLIKLSIDSGEEKVEFKEDNITMQLFREFVRNNKGKKGEPLPVMDYPFEGFSFGVKGDRYYVSFLDDENKEHFCYFRNFESVYDINEEELFKKAKKVKEVKTTKEVNISQNYEVYHELLLDLIDRHLEDISKSYLPKKDGEDFVLYTYAKDIGFDIVDAKRIVSMYVNLFEKEDLTAEDVKYFYEELGLEEAFNEAEFNAFEGDKHKYLEEDFYYVLNIKMLSEGLGEKMTNSSKVHFFVNLGNESLETKKQYHMENLRILLEGSFGSGGELCLINDLEKKKENSSEIGKIILDEYVQKFLKKYSTKTDFFDEKYNPKKDIVAFKSPSSIFKEYCSFLRFEDKINDKELRTRFDTDVDSQKKTILMGYITSEYINPLEGPELTQLRRLYKNSLVNFGGNKQKAEQELERMIDSLDMSKFFEYKTTNRKVLHSYYEVLSLDFDTLLDEVLEKMDENGKNSIWLRECGNCDIQIIKEGPDHYSINYFEPGNPSNVLKEYSSPKITKATIIEALNKDYIYDEGGKERVRTKELCQLYIEKKGATINQTFFEGTSEPDKTANVDVSIMYHLAQNDTVLLKKQINRAESEEVYVLYQEGSKYFLKTMKCLNSSYTIDTLPKLDKKIEHIDGKYPDSLYIYKSKETGQNVLQIETKEVSQADIIRLLDGINLREWDINFDSSSISSNIDFNGVNIQSDEKRENFLTRKAIEEDMNALALVNERNLTTEECVNLFLSDLYANLGYKSAEELESDESKGDTFRKAIYTFAEEGFKTSSNLDNWRSIFSVTEKKDKEGQVLFDVDMITYIDGKPSTIHLDDVFILTNDKDGKPSLRINNYSDFMETQISMMIRNRDDYTTLKNCFKNSNIEKDLIFKGFSNLYQFLAKTEGMQDVFDKLSKDMNIVNFSIFNDDKISLNDKKERLFKIEHLKLLETEYRPLFDLATKMVSTEQGNTKLSDNERNSLIIEKIKELTWDYIQYSDMIGSDSKFVGKDAIVEMFTQFNKVEGERKQMEIMTAENVEEVTTSIRMEL